jgi:hypothetical protein
VLAAIPGLDALVEGHLRGAAGKAVVASIKDSNRQDALIATWQESSVFKAFFGHNGPPPGLVSSSSQGGAGAAEGRGGGVCPAAAAGVVAPSLEVEEEEAGDETPPVRPPPAGRRVSQPPASQRSQSVASFGMVPEPKVPAAALGSPFQLKDSLSDIVAKDAAQSYDVSVFLCWGHGLTVF